MFFMNDDDDDIFFFQQFSVESQSFPEYETVLVKFPRGLLLTAVTVQVYCFKISVQPFDMFTL